MLSIAQTCYTAGRAYDEWRVSIACFASLAVPAAATSSLRSCGSSCRSRTHCATSARWHWCGGWTRLLPAKLSPSCACSAFAGPRCGSERAGLTRGRMLSHSAASRCSCSRIRSWRGSYFSTTTCAEGMYNLALQLQHGADAAEVMEHRRSWPQYYDVCIRQPELDVTFRGRKRHQVTHCNC